MLVSWFIVFTILLSIRPIESHRIELDVTSIGSPYKFELSSNNFHYLERDVLLGLVESTSSSIPSTIHLQASFDQMKVQRSFNFYQSNEKENNQSIKQEPIFRSYLLTPTFNRSYPFVRVLVASARGGFDENLIEPICATLTAINGRNIYENQACLISPRMGHCLVTVSLLKMLENKNKNQTVTKIELYLKLHHVNSSRNCNVDPIPQQDHIHHEMRIGYVEYVDYDHQFIATSTRSSISVDYPIGIHYPDWFIPLKLKMTLSSSLPSSFTIRCRFHEVFKVYSIQTNVFDFLSNYVQIEHQQFKTHIDFHILINQVNLKDVYEVDLSTIILAINSTHLEKNSATNQNRPYPIDWFFIKNNSSVDQTDVLIRTLIQAELDDIQTIVGLTDFTRLINTAMLSMQTERYPLRIVSVTYSGSIRTVTQAVCHSENDNLIQVESTCAHIYFSGHERDDFFDYNTSPTSIVIHYQRFLQRIHFSIFVPERPLTIEFSDTKLSRVHGWFVTHRDDDIDDDPNETLEQDDDDDDDEDDDDVKCYPVYQQSIVHVYTRFYRTTQNGDRIYLFNKLSVLVTPLVLNYLEAENRNVAIIRNGRVIAVGPGRTNIRIYSSPNRVPMGSKTIFVDDHETIRIINISFNLLTDIHLQTKLVEHVDPIYKILVSLRPIFNQYTLSNNKEFGQLVTILTYSDNTSISLDEISSEYYQLDIINNRATPSIIHYDNLPFWKDVKIRPVAAGQAYITARLKLGQQQCTDDRTFSQNDLSCPVFIASNENEPVAADVFSSVVFPATNYVVINGGQNQDEQTRLRASPLLLILSIVLGACFVLLIAFLLHYFINIRYRQKSKSEQRRQRNATNSGAEEANHDWIFLDRNSLEIPVKPPAQAPPSVHQSTLNVTSNPLINTSTLQRQTGLTELTHSQMIAYFDNLKESHA